MNDFLRYVLETGLCLIIFYSAYWLFLRRETFFLLNRVYLVSSLLLSFAIPALKVTSPFLTVPVPSGPIDLPGLASLPARSVSAADVLAAVYAAGALLFLARFALHLARLARVVRKNGAEVHNGFKVVSLDKDFAPFSFFRYIFINPQDFSPDNLRHILAHEQAHVRQGHSWDVLLAETVSILQWFNPIVRPYKKSIKETHEFLADGEVIAQGFNSARYRLLMLEQQVGSPLLELSNSFRQSQIKRRIVMISQNKSKGAARLKVLLLMPVAVLLVLALAQPRPVATAAPALALGSQDMTAQSQDETKIKELLAKCAEKMKALKDKEAQLRESLASTTDATKRADLQAALDKVAQMQEKLAAFMKNPVPPPPPLPPDPGFDAKAALRDLQMKEMEVQKLLEATQEADKREELKGKLDTLHQKQKDVEIYLKQYGGRMKTPPPPPAPPDREVWLKELAAKTAQVRMEMDKTEDASKKAELKAALEELEAKQTDLRIQMKTDAASMKVTVEDLAKMLAGLQEKETKIRAMLKETQVQEKVAELEGILKKIELKRADLKERIAAANKSSDEKK
jgi:hypothetical protein